MPAVFRHVVTLTQAVATAVRKFLTPARTTTEPDLSKDIADIAEEAFTVHAPHWDVDSYPNSAASIGFSGLANLPEPCD